MEKINLINEIEELIKKLGLETITINDVVNIYIPPYVKGVKTCYGRLKYKINDKKSIKNALKELKKIKISDLLKARIKTLENVLEMNIEELNKIIKEFMEYNQYILIKEEKIKNKEIEIESKYKEIDDDELLEAFKLRIQLLKNELNNLSNAINYIREMVEKQDDFYFKKQNEIIDKYDFLLGIDDYED